jgi:hypothetical protein
VFRPFASLLVTTVSRRIAQLNFPLNSRETAAGMSSGVVTLLDATSGQVAFTGWLRTQPTTGNIVYVGLYGVARPPGEAGPCVRVIFPLPRGSSMALLRPIARPDGSFRLSSHGRRFGDPGYYRIHQAAKGARRARYILALKETFDLWVDTAGRLHTDHQVRFFRVPILRLHYRLFRDT